MTEVYNHPDAKVDIVLVHGLNGDPRMTWTAPKNGMFWPSQLLPATLKNIHARVLVYGYNADVYAFGSGKSASSDMIYQHAQTLIQNLAMDRKVEQVQDHPIIFVCHSLGGVLVGYKYTRALLVAVCGVYYWQPLRFDSRSLT